MAKVVSLAKLARGEASQELTAAKDEPVLVTTDEGCPASWIVNADKLAQVAAALDVGDDDLYRRALTLLAVDLYHQEVLTIGQAAKLVGLPLSDFIDLCGRLHVPVLWEPPEGFGSEAEAAAKFFPSAFGTDPKRDT
jgi:hypothetical protein